MGMSTEEAQAEVERLNAAVNKVIADPAIQERFTRLGVEQVCSRHDSGAAVFRSHAKEVD